MNPFSPEQLSVVQHLLGDIATQASAVLDQPEERFRRFLHVATEFIRASNESLTGKTYALFLVANSASRPVLVLEEALGHINSGRTMFYVDEDLRLIDAVASGCTMADCAKRTEDSQALGLWVQGTFVSKLLKGKLLEDGDIVNPNGRPPILSKLHRSMAEFLLLLQDHKEQCIDRELRLRYWKDSAHRILLAGPDGTEKLFHHDLFWWMNMYVHDKLRVYGEPNTMGQDKTDIVVVTLNGSYVVEVKWMGVNESGTRFSESRIDQGVVQVDCYLNDDPTLVKGYLVVYDGRSREKHDSESRWDTSFLHVRCHKPIIIFLESETPSQIGDRVGTVRQRTRRRERRGSDQSSRNEPLQRA